ncbi:hypothetical protein LH464_23970 [Neorhizobium sp. T786]|uniref:hypothetical protein n=1 Tax=Pseudorhizobium xiangyangii TaxID=2883104 RepID=UPI001CFF56C7|nr:hypothetical protein [Neorhizobium xiangyangii]MCB5205505.1 hypothetical protein [Neorhizobium xiangyangii]
MPAERVAMRRVREILRYRFEEGLSHKSIAVRVRKTPQFGYRKIGHELMRGSNLFAWLRSAQAILWDKSATLGKISTVVRPFQNAFVDHVPTGTEFPLVSFTKAGNLPEAVT